MDNYLYKCVSLTPEISGEEDSTKQTAGDYEKVLNASAADGWELVQIDTLSAATTTKLFIFKKPGGISGDESGGQAKRCPACHNEVGKEDLYCENCAFKLK